MTLFNFMRNFDKPMMHAALKLMRRDFMAIPQTHSVLKLRQNLRRARMLTMGHGGKTVHA